MSKLRLSLACWNYDRTRALMDGSVQPDGIDLNYLDLPVEETFFRMLRHREFDVAEMSLSSYAVSMFREPRPFVAIPVFPSRFFRHSCIYVNAGSGIREPKDLIGKRVGTPEYQMTAPVWIRGILSEHYGVPVDSVTYYTGGEEEPGRRGKAEARPAAAHQGEADRRDTDARRDARKRRDRRAAHRAHAVDVLDRPAARSGACSTTTRKSSSDYFRKTGIFPIMHTVAIRRDVYEENRWIAQSLYKAFVDAQRRTYEDLYVTAALKAMLPWLTAHVEETRALMGDDFWSYGFERNRATLATFLRYHHEQGLSKLLSPGGALRPRGDGIVQDLTRRASDALGLTDATPTRRGPFASPSPPRGSLPFAPPVIALLAERHCENGGDGVVRGPRIAGNADVERRLRHVEPQRAVQSIQQEKTDDQFELAS